MKPTQLGTKPDSLACFTVPDICRKQIQMLIEIHFQIQLQTQMWMVTQYLWNLPIWAKNRFTFSYKYRIHTARNTDSNTQRKPTQIWLVTQSWWNSPSLAQSQIPLLCFCAGDHRRESGTPLLSKGLDCTDCTSFRVKT